MNEPIKPSRRRWFQFSLRALLVLMLVVAAYFAGFSTARKLDERAIRTANEQAAVERESARQRAMEAELHAFQERSMRDEVVSLMQSIATKRQANGSK